jgi:hypothetical protein
MDVGIRRERWREALWSLLKDSLRRWQERDPATMGSCMRDLLDYLPPDEANAMGQDPDFGSALLFLDAYFDALGHNFPNVDEGLSIEAADLVVKELTDCLGSNTYQFPEEIRVFGRYLPFRP